MLYAEVMNYKLVRKTIVSEDLKINSINHCALFVQCLLSGTDFGFSQKLIFMQVNTFLHSAKVILFLWHSKLKFDGKATLLSGGDPNREPVFNHLAMNLRR